MKLRGITAAVLIWSCFPALAQQDGAALYSQHCAQCHDSGNKDIRAPDRSAMRSMTFEAVLGTITSGSMASMVEGRTKCECVSRVCAPFGVTASMVILRFV